jgi:hypothetical protein
MDLLAVHEVGHLFVDQAANQFDFHLPRRWLVELFCNLGLHATAAKHVDTAAGETALRRLYEFIVQAKPDLPDEQLEAILRDDVHSGVAKVLTSWASDS